MSVLSTQTLRLLRPVEPFHERTVASGMTFGVGPAGYDVRIAEDVDIRRWQPRWPFRCWAGGFRLASTVERFDLPADCLGYVKDKSTWARRGLFVQNTVIEPGWCGYLTLELTAVRPIHIPSGSPIAQVVFHRLDEATVLPYRGKYQDQAAGPQPAILVLQEAP